MRIGQAEQSAHELDLVQHGFEEEYAEVGQCRIREIAPAIEIAATPLVGGFEAGVITLAPSREPAGQRPQSVTINAVMDKQRVRLEPDHAPVSVAKRVNPGEAMMGGSDDHEPVSFQKMLIAVK